MGDVWDPNTCTLPEARLYPPRSKLLGAHLYPPRGTPVPPHAQWDFHLYPPRRGGYRRASGRVQTCLWEGTDVPLGGYRRASGRVQACLWEGTGGSPIEPGRVQVCLWEGTGGKVSICPWAPRGTIVKSVKNSPPGGTSVTKPCLLAWYVQNQYHLGSIIRYMLCTGRPPVSNSNGSLRHT